MIFNCSIAPNRSCESPQLPVYTFLRECFGTSSHFLVFLLSSCFLSCGPVGWIQACFQPCLARFFHLFFYQSMVISNLYLRSSISRLMDLLATVCLCVWMSVVCPPPCPLPSLWVCNVKAHVFIWWDIVLPSLHRLTPETLDTDSRREERKRRVLDGRKNWGCRYSVHSRHRATPEREINLIKDACHWQAGCSFSWSPISSLSHVLSLN